MEDDITHLCPEIFSTTLFFRHDGCDDVLPKDFRFGIAEKFLGIFIDERDISRCIKPEDDAVCTLNEGAVLLLTFPEINDHSLKTGDHSRDTFFEAYQFLAQGRGEGVVEISGCYEIHILNHSGDGPGQVPDSEECNQCAEEQCNCPERNIKCNTRGKGLADRQVGIVQFYDPAYIRSVPLIFEVDKQVPCDASGG